jgi:amino acid transporter
MASVPGSDFDVAQLPDASVRHRTNVLVVSSVALAFISFWRAAAIVLCDLASTAYYIGGISEQAVGKAAPWFILGVMLFSYAVRAVYVESCTMFTRGGVYRVVKEAMGGTLAKLSVSALMFDYVLTGPISGVSAGQYIVGLFIDLINLLNAHHGHPLIDPTHFKNTINVLTVIIAILITIWFWRTNIRGIHESSDQALWIMQLTTVMGVIIIAWSLLTMGLHPSTLKMPPAMPVFTADSSGWLTGMPRIIGMLGVLMAFGHTLLAMSGEESLAQVNREIEAPKLKNLLRAGFVIFMYSLLLTSLISFFAVLIIPDGKRVATYVVPNGSDYDAHSTQVDYLRPSGTAGKSWGYQLADTTTAYPKPTQNKVYVGTETGMHVERDDGGYRDNLINGLVQYLVGPSWLKVIMECFVVLVGFLILAGAVNTSIVGSNGVMNRLAEDGVLTPWFLHPQKQFGTTHRLINMVVVLQLLTIIASWGDVDTLGEAYAFGVIWSFVFKTFAMVVLRFKDKRHREYEVPMNIRTHNKSGAEIDLPIGITIIFLVLLSTALINLVTKKTATIWGVGFTVAFMAAFVILEHISARKRGGGHHQHLEQFNEKSSDTLTLEAAGVTHPNPILVAARGPRSLPVLQKILQETNTNLRDVVVVTCKVLPAMTVGVTERETTANEEDRNLLTKIVTVAEEVGKEVKPVVLPTNNPLYAIARAARDLKATEVVLGVSEKVHAEEQLEQFALAWGSVISETDGEEPKLTVRIMGPQVEMKYEMS